MVHYSTPMTPSWSHRSDPHCLKSCGQIGTFFHCWSSCPKIQTFWDKIFYQINKITAFTLPFDPKIILLDYWDIDSFQPSDSKLISVLLTAAKCPIAHCWKLPQMPTVKAWYQNIWDLLASNRMSNYIHNNELPAYRSYVLEKWSNL